MGSNLDAFIQRLIVGTAIIILAMAIAAIVQTAQAQGGGYTIEADPPAGVAAWKNNRFWYTLNDNGQQVTWLMIVSAYVVYSDGRPTDYLILRTDNLQDVRDLDDPICPTVNYNEHVIIDLPPPTFFIWSAATTQPFIHAPC